MGVTFGDSRLPERFWDKVDVNAATGCWIWTRALASGGYGTITVDNIQYRTHKLAYEVLVEPVPNGLVLDHLCRERRCANPDHLEPVTRGENTARGAGSNGVIGRASHCPKGHPFAGENLWFDNRGWRRCRTCDRARCASYWHRVRKARLAAANSGGAA